MDNHENADHGQSSQPPPIEPTSVQQRPFERLVSGFRQGAENARKAAERALPRFKTAAAEADYWAGYGIAYAGVFSATLAKGLTPEALKTGLQDGVKAGRDAATRWMEGLKSRRTSPDPGPALIGPATAAGASGPMS